MKKQTKAQKFNDLANAVRQIRKGEPVKRIGAKDGSIVTHPVVTVPDFSESVVLAECLTWLRKHRIFCNRMNVGAGEMGTSGFHTYGIPGAGDIIGMLRNYNGKHFEIECKKGSGGRLSLSQQRRMKKVRENGGLYFVVHGAEELAYYMKRYTVC